MPLIDKDDRSKANPVSGKEKARFDEPGLSTTLGEGRDQRSARGDFPTKIKLLYVLSVPI